MSDLPVAESTIRWEIEARERPGKTIHTSVAKLGLADRCPSQIRDLYIRQEEILHGVQ